MKTGGGRRRHAGADRPASAWPAARPLPPGPEASNSDDVGTKPTGYEPARAAGCMSKQQKRGVSLPVRSFGIFGYHCMMTRLSRSRSNSEQMMALASRIHLLVGRSLRSRRSSGGAPRLALQLVLGRAEDAVAAAHNMRNVSITV